MLTRARAAALAARAGCAIAAIAALAGCGGSASRGAGGAKESASTKAPAACAAAVMATLYDVARRIYHEGVVSERTASARYLIGASHALGRAVEEGNASAARAAATELIATGHMVDLTVLRKGHVLVSTGASGALAPLRGTIRGASGA